MTGITWQGASTGQPPAAEQVNQLLASHAISYVYEGAQVAAQTTVGSGHVSSNGNWMGQKFNTGSSTTIGRVFLEISVTGTPAPITVSLYIDSGGAPSGAPIVSTVLPKEFVGSSGTGISVPLPAAVAASTNYWIVLAAQGDVSDFFAWYLSNQTSGASTSPNGTTWTAQAYGFIFEVFDQTTTAGGLSHTWEDSGARWTIFAYSGTNGGIAKVYEFTAGQTANGYTTGVRSLSYSGGTITGVA